MATIMISILIAVLAAAVIIHMVKKKIRQIPMRVRLWFLSSWGEVP